MTLVLTILFSQVNFDLIRVDEYARAYEQVDRTGEPAVISVPPVVHSQVPRGKWRLFRRGAVVLMERQETLPVRVVPRRTFCPT